MPKTLGDLESHKFIARSRPDENPYSDVSWALRIGRQNKEAKDASFTGTSSEALLKAASRGIGITASYEEMEGHKKYSLVRILAKLAKQEQKQYLVYPKHLQEVEKIKTLEKFLIDRFLKLRRE